MQSWIKLKYLLLSLSLSHQLPHKPPHPPPPHTQKMLILHHWQTKGYFSPTCCVSVHFGSAESNLQLLYISTGHHLKFFLCLEAADGDDICQSFVSSHVSCSLLHCANYMNGLLPSYLQISGSSSVTALTPQRALQIRTHSGIFHVWNCSPELRSVSCGGSLGDAGPNWLHAGNALDESPPHHMA